MSIGQQKKNICEICTDEEEKLKQMHHTDLAFVNENTKFEMSALAEHRSTDSSKHATEVKQNQQATMCKVILEVPTDNAISSDCIKEALTKLHDAACYLALKGRPFSYFNNLKDLEKLHWVKFQPGAYENKASCWDFIDSINKVSLQGWLI